ncbi:hypothetical protein Sp245p_31340 (plasmid) [Azospirillum baldaniorum]|uniref:Uncharacterized protein n=1 Tax=Azospirillum baldaniorum TaxID=1064539 RepID=A0A9P1K1J2_9PROT|nr:hypothetical protein Sp245p_31340 [Azospirillum baldaniorum]CCD03879.1 protein of unknown function [Azospirillum baldaniorum]
MERLDLHSTRLLISWRTDSYARFAAEASLPVEQVVAAAASKLASRHGAAPTRRDGGPNEPTCG